MLDIKETVLAYLLPAGLVGVIAVSGLALSSREFGSDIFNMRFDDAYNQIPGDLVTHDEYYLIGHVAEDVGYVSLGVKEVIHGPNDVSKFLFGRDTLTVIPNPGDTLVLKTFVSTDEKGFLKREVSYYVVRRR